MKYILAFVTFSCSGFIFAADFIEKATDSNQYVYDTFDTQGNPVSPSKKVILSKSTDYQSGNPDGEKKDYSTTTQLSTYAHGNKNKGEPLTKVNKDGSITKNIPKNSIYELKQDAHIKDVPVTYNQSKSGVAIVKTDSSKRAISYSKDPNVSAGHELCQKVGYSGYQKTNTDGSIVCYKLIKPKKEKISEDNLPTTNEVTEPDTVPLVQPKTSR